MVALTKKKKNLMSEQFPHHVGSSYFTYIKYVERTWFSLPSCQPQFHTGLQ